MKKLKLCLLLVLGLTIIYSCSKDDLTTIEEEAKFEASDSALRGGNTPAVNGQGTIEWPGIEGKRQFSFQVKTKKDGSVSGSGVLTYTKGERKVRFSINCIYVVDNMATMSGRITSHSENPEWEGNPCRFSIIDNGEGKNADPDRMTPLFFALSDGPDWICEGFYGDAEYREVLKGNIQVSGGN